MSKINKLLNEMQDMTGSPLYETIHKKTIEIHASIVDLSGLLRKVQDKETRELLQTKYVDLNNAYAYLSVVLLKNKDNVS